MPLSKYPGFQSAQAAEWGVSMAGWSLGTRVLWRSVGVSEVEGGAVEWPPRDDAGDHEFEITAQLAFGANQRPRLGVQAVWYRTNEGLAPVQIGFETPLACAVDLEQGLGQDSFNAAVNEVLDAAAVLLLRIKALARLEQLVDETGAVAQPEGDVSKAAKGPAPRLMCEGSEIYAVYGSEALISEIEAIAPPGWFVAYTSASILPDGTSRARVLPRDGSAM